MVVDSAEEYAGKLLCVGTNGKLYTCENLYDAPKLARDPGGTVKDVCFMKDGTILGVGSGGGLTDGKLYTRKNLDSNWVYASPNGTFKRISLRKDGGLIGVGSDSQIYTIPKLSSGNSFTLLPGNGTVLDACEMDDLSILVAGMNQNLWTQNKGETIWNEIKYSGSVNTVAIMDNGGILAIGNDQRLWERATLSSSWYQVGRNTGSYLSVAYCRRPVQPILCAGGDGKVYKRETIYDEWIKTPACAGTVKSIGWTDDGKIIAIGKGDGLQEGHIYTRDDLSKPWVLRYSSCQFHAIATRGSEMVLLGTNYLLYTLADFYSLPYKVPEHSSQPDWKFKDVSVMDDGTIIAIGMGDTCWTRRHWDEKWKNIPGSGTIKAVSVMEHGAICAQGYNNDLVYKENLSCSWKKAPFASNNVQSLQYCHKPITNFNDMKEVKPLILLLTKVTCNKDSAETGNDEVYFRLFKDGAVEPEVIGRDSPISMNQGDTCYCDIEIDCTYLTRLMVQLGEKDSGSNSDDTLGDFYFDRNMPIDDNGNGSITVNQTTGDAKARYTLYYRVLSKPIPTLRIFGLKCHKSTAGCSELFVEECCDLSAKIVRRAGAVVGKTPYPGAKAVSAGMKVASELIELFAADIVMWICDKLEGADDVVLQHAGVTDSNGGNMIPCPSENGRIHMDDPLEGVEVLWKDDKSMVFFDTYPYQAGPNADYVRIPLDQEDVTIQLKEHDWFKETGMGRLTITREKYKEFAGGPMEMSYLDEYLRKQVKQGEGCLYSMAWSVGEENWAANATAGAQLEQRVFKNLKDAQACLKTLREKHCCIVPIAAWNEGGEKKYEAKDPKEYLQYNMVPQKEGGEYWFKYWSNDEDVERLKTKAEGIFEHYLEDNDVFGGGTLWAFVKLGQDWDRCDSLHTQLNLTHDEAYNYVHSGIRGIIQVDKGVANHNQYDLKVNGKTQGSGDGWNADFGNKDSDLKELWKRAEMNTCHFVVVGIY